MKRTLKVRRPVVTKKPAVEKNNSATAEKVVSKAMTRAAKHLKISNVELSSIIGISEPQLSRIGAEKVFLNRKKKEFELAVLFTRLYRSLDAITGGDDSVSAEWMRNSNNALNEKPVEKIKTIGGLIDVITYLDSRRAPI